MSRWCPLSRTLFRGLLFFSEFSLQRGGSSFIGNCAVEKSSSLHLSAELNCGTSLEVESPFSQRCDFCLFFSRLIGCSNAVPFETASCWGLVHCPCAVIQYQEQAGDKGTGVRQCCDARASSQLWKLCTAETLLIYTAGCLTGKGVIMQQHLGVQHLDEAACIGILGAQLWVSGFENLSQDTENTWENTGILYHHPDLPFQWLRQLDTNYLLASGCLRGYKTSRPTEERKETDSVLGLSP